MSGPCLTHPNHPSASPPTQKPPQETLAISVRFWSNLVGTDDAGRLISVRFFSCYYHLSTTTPPLPTSPFLLTFNLHLLFLEGGATSNPGLPEQKCSALPLDQRGELWKVSFLVDHNLTAKSYFDKIKIWNWANLWDDFVHLYRELSSIGCLSVCQPKRFLMTTGLSVCLAGTHSQWTGIKIQVIQWIRQQNTLCHFPSKHVLSPTIHSSRENVPFDRCGHLLHSSFPCDRRFLLSFFTEWKLHPFNGIGFLMMMMMVVGGGCCWCCSRCCWFITNQSIN